MDKKELKKCKDFIKLVHRGRRLVYKSSSVVPSGRSYSRKQKHRKGTCPDA